MEFKLSAREVLILEDRDKILRELRRGRQQRGARQRARGHRRPTRPPVLVVPQDQSGLIQVIERDRSYSDGEVEAGTANRKKKERQEEEGTVWRRWWRDLEEKEEEGPLPENLWQRAVFLLRRLRLLLRRLLELARRARERRRERRRERPPRVRRRGAISGPPPSAAAVTSSGHAVIDGLALSVSGTALTAAGVVLNGAPVGAGAPGRGRGRRSARSAVPPEALSSAWLFFANPKLRGRERTLSTKCDVCVLSDYSKVFAVLDAVLETDLGIGLDRREEQKGGGGGERVGGRRHRSADSSSSSSSTFRTRPCRARTRVTSEEEEEEEEEDEEDLEAIESADGGRDLRRPPTRVHFRQESSLQR